MSKYKNSFHIHRSKLLIIFILSINFISTTEAQNTTSLNKKNVGHIEFNSKTDDSAFYICNELNIKEYYQVNTRYKEGAKSIRNYLNPFLNQINKLLHFNEGIITIRFIVNCKGETDRFRVLAVNDNYKSIELRDELRLNCIDVVRGLDNWNSEPYKGKYFDSYYILSLKIRNGKVTDILP